MNKRDSSKEEQNEVVDIDIMFKATEGQGFVNIDTITSPKIVFIPSTVTFKFTFADGSVTMTKLIEFVKV